MARLPGRRPLLYYITDRRALPNQDPLPVIAAAIAAGVDLIQLRERDLETRALLALVERVLELARGTASSILVNDRLDVALAAGAAGVHLPVHSFPVAVVREKVGDALLVGASAHNLAELRAAEAGGADFVVFGPVFETPSKPACAGRRDYGPPLGLEKLAEAVQTAKIPVLALGGVNLANAADCLRAGVAGLAAISLFQTSTDLSQTVAQLRQLAA